MQGRLKGANIAQVALICVFAFWCHRYALSAQKAHLIAYMLTRLPLQHLLCTRANRARAHDQLLRGRRNKTLAQIRSGLVEIITIE